MRGAIGSAILLLAASACGGAGGGGGGAGPGAFIGTWDATGQLAVGLTTPLGAVNSFLPATGVATIASGGRSDEIVLTHENGCSIPATVVADRATIADGTSCTISSSGSNVTITFHTGTLTRQDAATLSLNASGDAIATTSGSPLGGGSGSFTWTGTMTRAAP
ncbi:MAG TPA: hypothetical protein VGK67_33885 [Myxococcales bacterium]|jgi:hypothetical protein